MVDQVKSGANPLPVAPTGKPHARKANQDNATAPAPAGDSKQLSQGAQIAQRSRDIDLEVNFSTNGTTLQGRTIVPQQEVQRLLTNALQSSDLYNVNVSFDPAGGGYRVKAKYSVDWLPDPSFAFTIKPEVSGSSFKLSITDIDTTGSSFEAVKKWVVGAIGKQLTHEGLAKSVDVANHAVELDTRALIERQAKYNVGQINWAHDSATLAVDPQGNLQIAFTESGRPAPAPGTAPAHPEVRVQIDRDHLLSALRQRYSNDRLKFTDLTLADGSMSLKADVSYMELGNALAALGGIFVATVGMASGSSEGVQAGAEIMAESDKNTKHRLGQLDMKIEGLRLTLSSSDNKILDAANDALDKQKIAARHEKKQIIIDDIRQLFPDLAGVESLQITPLGITIEGKQ